MRHIILFAMFMMHFTFASSQTPVNAQTLKDKIIWQDDVYKSSGGFTIKGKYKGRGVIDVKITEADAPKILAGETIDSTGPEGVIYSITLSSIHDTRVDSLTVNLKQLETQGIYKVLSQSSGNRARYNAANAMQTTAKTQLDLVPESPHLVLKSGNRTNDPKFEITEEQATKILAGEKVEIVSQSGKSNKHIQKNTGLDKLIYA